MSVDEARREEASRFRARACVLIGEECSAFTVGDGDGKPRTGHVTEENRGAFLDLNQGESRLELFRAVPNEARPVLGTGNEILQMREHLAAVADPESKT